MTNCIKPAELFDVDVDQLAGTLALIAADRFGRLQRTELVEPTPLQDAADGGGRDRELAGDLGAGVALAAQSLDGVACGPGSLVWR